MRLFTFLFGGVLMLFSNLIFSQKANSLFDNDRMHEIRVTFTNPNYWDDMGENYLDFREFSGDDVPNELVHVEIDGEQLDSVGMRFKGKSAWYYANDKKKPFRLDFNEFVSGRSYGALKKINLHNGMGDPSMMRELLGYGMLRQAGVKVPRVSFTKLYLNDEYWGVYTIVEAVDKPFLEKNFPSGEGNLWKNQRWSELEWLGDSISNYNEIFQLKTNDDENDWSKFIEFMDVLNNSSNEDFPSLISEIFNVENYLRVLAVDIMINNWDSYIDNQRNFYLYYEPRSQKFQWIPWDYNLSMGGDLTLIGNPYRSFDENCPMKTDFTIVTNGNEISCSPVTDPPAESYYWTFGEGNFSRFQNPIHTYTQQGKFEICLTTERVEGADTCRQIRCKKVDLTDPPADCESVQNGSSPYPSSDPIFQLVIEEDPHCCDEWDVFCELKYIEFEDNLEPNFNYEIEYDYDYELDFKNSDKILIHRLLNVPEFKERYIEHACLIRDQIFNSDNLFPIIDQAANLIRQDLYDDPNYLYTRDYFEYNVGNGTGGGGNATIPALKYVFNIRFPQIDEDLADFGTDCSSLSSPIVSGDVVINEFVASNSEDGGVADPAGSYADWIEIYNNTGRTIDLFHFYLSDNPDDSKRWQFPEGTFLEPNGYLIVWADKDSDQSGLHADFKLKKEGEFLSLAHEDGTVIDSLSFGEQETNIAFARMPNGVGDFKKQEATFGKNNEETSAILEFFGSDFNMLAFPNPTSGRMTISLKNADLSNPILIKIEDLSGRTILAESQKFTNRFELNFSDFIEGIYFLKVENGAEQSIKKIIVNN